MDQIGFGEREVGRTRMSVEEQLERIRRNQEASSLREKKRETPSRSPSFNKENPFIIMQVTSLNKCEPMLNVKLSVNSSVYVCDQTRAHAEGACADPVELEAALQQLKVAHIEQSRSTAEAAGTHTERALTALQVHEVFIQIFSHHSHRHFH